MILTNKVAAKFAVAIVAAAMMFAAFVPATNAQNIEDMSLEQLLALVAQLQAQTGSTASASDACPYTWTRSLNTGATGADVMQLQKFLNSMPETQVAPVGQAGSAGMETSYYGPATGAAVANFQMKYRAEILSPLGLVNATTFFGPSTMAQANKLCVASTTPTPTPGTTPKPTLSGEAALDTYEVDTGEEDEVEEGTTAEVAELTVEFSDGDASISRLDIMVDNGSIDPWDVFEEFTLWVDGDKVASVDASDEDDYLNEDDGTLRFSGLNIVGEEDEEVVIVIAATTQKRIDSSDMTGTWTLTVEGMRWFDADDVATTENDASGTATFTVEDAGYEEELTFRESDDNPDATTIIVDKNTARTRNVEIMRYEIEAEGGDIDLDTLFVDITTGTAGHNMVIDKLWIEIDGEKFKAKETLATTSTSTYSFDIDGDITIDEDDTEEVMVMVDFKGSNNASNFALSGETIKAEVTSANVAATEAEGADDVTDLNGAADGEEHMLAAEGLVAMIDEVTTSSSNNVTTVTFKFDVTAVEGDFWISATTTTAITDTIGFSATGTVTEAPSISVAGVTKNSSGNFRISDGTTKKVTATYSVTNTGATAGYITGALTALDFGNLATNATNETAIVLTSPEFDVPTNASVAPAN